ncbi:MAG: group 1 truncated hemoglobin [Methylococcales bacterium]
MTINLYDKYGGFETVSKIVHGLYEKITASEVLQPYFDNVDIQKLMNHQTKFFSSIMGGPVQYDATQLTEVHQNLHITEEAFIEFSELLEEVLEDFDVLQQDIDTLLAIVVAVKLQIVQGN